jgi:hypothetical protein
MDVLRQPFGPAHDSDCTTRLGVHVKFPMQAQGGFYSRYKHYRRESSIQQVQQQQQPIAYSLTTLGIADDKATF